MQFCFRGTSQLRGNMKHNEGTFTYASARRYRLEHSPRVAGECTHSFSELGRRVGLSTPAVAERVRQMEDAGIIRGFHAEVDPAKLGLGVLAFIRVKVSGDKLQTFTEVVRSCPEALECHRVTGSESFIVKVAVTDINHLESVIDALMPYEATTTSMIFLLPSIGAL